MAAETLDVAALDSAATAVEIATPALDTNEVQVSAVESPEQTTDKPAATAEDGKPEDKAVTDTATAPITPKEIVEQLQELKKTNEPLAKEIHKQVKYSLEAQRLIKELAPDAKTLAEAKELIANRVSPEIQETFDAVQATDQLLYTGGEAHKELVENILEDLKSTLGDEGPARFSELTSNMLSKMKDTDPAGYVQHQRTNFLDASEQSGLIESLNKLSGHLVAGRTAEAKALLGNVVKFSKRKSRPIRTEPKRAPTNKLRRPKLPAQPSSRENRNKESSGQHHKQNPWQLPCAVCTEGSERSFSFRTGEGSRTSLHRCACGVGQGR